MKKEEREKIIDERKVEGKYEKNMESDYDFEMMERKDEDDEEEKKKKGKEEEGGGGLMGDIIGKEIGKGRS